MSKTTNPMRPRGTKRQRLDEGVVDMDVEGVSPAPSAVDMDVDDSATSSSLALQYEKKSPIDHILHRPDTYVGSVERVDETMPLAYTAGRIEYAEVAYSPALYKIFDELLVNAADNHFQHHDTTALAITVTADSVTVRNTGRGIPVELHPVEKVYVPELIFGHLLTSSNYDDSVSRFTGGRNGYGAKLCNIFSSKFKVETCFGGAVYTQVFADNMKTRAEPKIRRTKRKDYTSLLFVPDVAVFGEDCLDAATVAIFRKRAHDMAAVLPKVKVVFNGDAIVCKGFKAYPQFYVPRSDEAPEGDVSTDTAEDTVVVDLDALGDSSDAAASTPASTADAADATASTPDSTADTAPLAKPRSRVVEFVSSDGNWDVAVMASPDGQFHQTSFVNSVSTHRGGTHVDHVASRLADLLAAALTAKKSTSTTVSAQHVKSNMWLFVNARIRNPTFDSQMKGFLTLAKGRWGSVFDMGASPDQVVKRILASTDIAQLAVASAEAKNQSRIAKQMTSARKQCRLTGIPKLDDAQAAGTRESSKCVLILTEGDSAKTLAVSGLSVVGRKYYGVFPLRGKLLNVQQASNAVVAANAEVQNLIKILGLRKDAVYHDTSSLRYGKIMIFTDGDLDGTHISGLLLNLFFQFWPSLLANCPGFVQDFITPVIKASHRGTRLSFFSTQAYEAWCAEHGTSGTGVKYYKGLGTNTAAEAKAYFSKMAEHCKTFEYSRARDADRLALAFSKGRVQDRKTWIAGYAPATHESMDPQSATKTVADFVDRELLLFSVASNVRAIPSLVDGLKPGQRKVLHVALKRNLTADIKVAQFGASVAEQTAYQHGEASLFSTIVCMAQNYVGTNNLELLVPSGQFGSRLEGGKDCASPRYIYTRLAPWTRAIFRVEDDAVLTPQVEEGKPIEPLHFVPIIPMVLVNGAIGIGTGYATLIPSFAVADLCAVLRAMLNGAPVPELVPSFRGFTGTVEPRCDASGRMLAVTTTGSYEVTTAGALHRRTKAKAKGKAKAKAKAVKGGQDQLVVLITELPIGVWVRTVKDKLEKLLASSAGIVAEYTEHHTDTEVEFHVFLKDTVLEPPSDKRIVDMLGLTSQLSMQNMVLFDARGALRTYTDPAAIVEDFFAVRMALYVARKQHLEATKAREIEALEAKIAFLQGVLDKTIDIGGDEGALRAQLGEHYDMLTKMPLRALSRQNMAALVETLAACHAALAEIKAQTPKDMWLADLEAVCVATRE